MVDNKLKECLSASLTLLVMLGVLEKQDALKRIKENNYDGLFELLNDKYIEIKNR
jgi:flagellar biosynthesis regulator FlaF